MITRQRRSVAYHYDDSPTSTYDLVLYVKFADARELEVVINDINSAFRVRVLDHPRVLHLDTIWFLKRTHWHWRVPSASNWPCLRFRKGIACAPSLSISALAPASTRRFSALREGSPICPAFHPGARATGQLRTPQPRATQLQAPCRPSRPGVVPGA
jgi:hypothetical protein